MDAALLFRAIILVGSYALVFGRGNLDCVNPTCATVADRATLWPFSDPNFFLRCEEPGWNLVRRPCIAQRLFHFVRQECVEPSEWEEPCPDERPDLPQCPQVVCRTVQDQRKLWPHEDANHFLQCIPRPNGGMQAVRRNCPNDSLFSWNLQQCVPSSSWRMDCTFDDDQSTTVEDETETTATPETTTPLTTTTTVPDRGICPVPICRIQDPRLYPHSDWTMYYQCVPQQDGSWAPLERPCAPGTRFHYGFQVCVWPAQWEDFCL
ncbi:uncharacterized protein LOC129763366 [Toxorhynchites rutilus septentrionalis]|uniref:uncharacterized protein LOC129763366 n=1 Tax=Toxorhynchites rutilus septentrionalis TaxID=329112 RepID=UPI0024795C02|nr:uncharacterized protein LOC129763366 [Toxorhynchites rutilus septentrionalis]